MFKYVLTIGAGQHWSSQRLYGAGDRAPKLAVLTRRKGCEMWKALLAFLIVLGTCAMLFVSSGGRSRRSAKDKQKTAMYACGERAVHQTLRITVTSYKYLIYFMVFDAPVILVALSSLAASIVNLVLLLAYLFAAFIALLLLTGGSDY